MITSKMLYFDPTSCRIWVAEPQPQAPVATSLARLAGAALAVRLALVGAASLVRR